MVDEAKLTWSDLFTDPVCRRLNFRENTLAFDFRAICEPYWTKYAFRKTAMGGSTKVEEKGSEETNVLKLFVELLQSSVQAILSNLDEERTIRLHVVRRVGDGSRRCIVARGLAIPRCRLRDLGIDAVVVADGRQRAANDGGVVGNAARVHGGVRKRGC